MNTNMIREDREAAIQWLRAAAGREPFLRESEYLNAGADALEASLHGLLMTEPQLKEAIIAGGPEAVIVEDFDGELALVDREEPKA